MRDEMRYEDVRLTLLIPRGRIQQVQAAWRLDEGAAERQYEVKHEDEWTPTISAVMRLRPWSWYDDAAKWAGGGFVRWLKSTDWRIPGVKSVRVDLDRQTVQTIKGHKSNVLNTSKGGGWFLQTRQQRNFWKWKENWKKKWKKSQLLCWLLSNKLFKCFDVTLLTIDYWLCSSSLDASKRRMDAQWIMEEAITTTITNTIYIEFIYKPPFINGIFCVI